MTGDWTMPPVWRCDDWPCAVWPQPPAEELSRRDRLLTLRGQLTEACATAAARDLAPLAGRLQSVLADIESLPGGEESFLDDLAKRRAGRVADAEAG